jgi:hypothetical protein
VPATDDPVIPGFIHPNPKFLIQDILDLQIFRVQDILDFNLSGSRTNCAEVNCKKKLSEKTDEEIKAERESRVNSVLLLEVHLLIWPVMNLNVLSVLPL